MLKKAVTTERVLLTPEMAMQMLEHNQHNRPLSEAHVKVIAGQIAEGLWRFNGDTIKVADDESILDGQHRCWAVVEAKKPIDTIIVRGVDKGAFATIDTLRRSRSAADTVALMGATTYRVITAGSLTWLIRWQRGVMTAYRAPEARVTNRDIEIAFEANPHIINAAREMQRHKRVLNPSVGAFIYYVATNRNPEIAAKFVGALEDPSRLSMTHPLFQLRAYLTTFSPKKRDPVHTIALAFKALNAVAAGRSIKFLKWTNQGKTAEEFPELKI